MFAVSAPTLAPSSAAPPLAFIDPFGPTRGPADSYLDTDGDDGSLGSSKGVIAGDTTPGDAADAESTTSSNAAN